MAPTPVPAKLTLPVKIIVLNHTHAIPGPKNPILNQKKADLSA